MRIAMVTAQAFPLLGGIESHVDEVATRLAAAGHQVTVLTTDRSGVLPRETQRNGALVRRFRAWPRTRDYYASPGLFWAVLRGDFDVIHVQGIHTVVPPLAMLAATVGRKPFVVTFHTGGSSSEFRSKMRTTQFRLLAPLLRRARALVAVSEFEARRFEAVLGLPTEAIPVIRNGGMTPALAGEISPVPDLILSVGRLERYKGHHRAIEALPLIQAQRPGARLRILGAGPYERELLLLAERRGVAGSVSIDFVPPQEREAMVKALCEAAVVSLLSDYESHPVAVIEALAVGRPVIVLNNSGLTELVEAGWVLGLDADATTDEVAGAIVSQLAQPRTIAVEQLPTWTGCVEQLEQVYERCTAEARPRGEEVNDGAS